MLRHITHALAVLTFLWVGHGQIKANLVVNGDFSSPNVGGSYQIISSGMILGWTSNNPDMEIDYSPVVSMPCISAGRQSAELIGGLVPGGGGLQYYDTISQTVTGLVTGGQYVLSWDWGARNFYGNSQESQTYWGGSLVTTNSGPVTGTWVPNSFIVTASGPSENISFTPLTTSVDGDEITNVSLDPAVPEPGYFALLSAAMLAVALVLYRRRRLS